SYWEQGTPADRLPSFTQFQQGYSGTSSVRLTVGRAGGDVGAGQIRYGVPVALAAKSAAGGMQAFSGCYTLHLAQPAIQAASPFHPLAIRASERRGSDGRHTGGRRS
ncbi:MAG: hypothetical protein ACREJM_03930, partial [Candidatus Saccharimonadales bacterium]